MISNSVDDQVCVGSTGQTLNARWGHYRNLHNNPNHGNYNWKISELMREYGFDKFEIEALEQDEFESRSELYAREGCWQLMLMENGYNLTNTLVARGCSNNSSEYYKANPESYERKLARKRERINCEVPGCNATFTRSNKARHMKRYHST